MNTTRTDTKDPPAEPENEAATRRIALERRGYRVALRESGWVECLLVRDEERWLGRGLTEAEALDDALAQMLPSALARELWREALAHERAPAEEVSEEPVADARPETEPAPPEEEAPAATSEEEAPAEEPREEPYVATVVALSVPHLAPARPAPKTPPPDPKRPSSLARLTSIQRELGRDMTRLARMAPELLRLEMLATICRARAFTDEHPGDVIVERAVGDVARDLTDLGKRWWPGSVRALQLRATPADVAREVPVPCDTVPSRWDEAVSLVDEAQAALLRRSDTSASGWADDHECEPSPPDPAATLREVTSALDPKRATEATLLDQARKLRWVRTHLPDDAAEAWADAMGVLRRHADRAGIAALRAVLDPGYRPHGNWAREAGHDPRARTLKKRRAKLLRGMPRSGATPEVVAAWLSQAFELGDELPNPKIARHIGHLKEVVLALSDDDLQLDERRLRRRLSSLQEMLASDHLEAEDAPDEADFEDDDDDEDDELEDDGLTAQVRDKAQGQRALLLSNRADPDLERKLQDSLGLEVTLSLVDTRRRQAAAQAVESGSYEIILAAHRFIGHDVDKDIGQRARAGGIPYVRVGSGRVGSVVRALAREWGL